MRGAENTGLPHVFHGWIKNTTRTNLKRIFGYAQKASKLLCDSAAMNSLENLYEELPQQQELAEYDFKVTLTMGSKNVASCPCFP